MEKVLLHVCCAPCSLGCLDKLKDKELILFFSNSNIYPKEEFIKRFKELEKLGKIQKLTILLDKYNHDNWLNFIKGLENEPEQGKRCFKCFEFNLNLVAQKAKEIGADFFTTTLSISPHKLSKDLFEIGKRISEEVGVKFLDLDFSEDFSKSVVLSKKFNLYRQNYCGCEFSLKK
jgi:hypothetical protein